MYILYLIKDELNSDQKPKDKELKRREGYKKFKNRFIKWSNPL